MPSPSQGELYFGVDARHIRQLGQELVGDRTTALTELIKNAYDADAAGVTLRFERALRKPGGVLEVEDDGNGMTLREVERGWMRISTNMKAVQDRSPRYGRTRAGRKGIGRFATETLGGKLILRTKARGQTRAIVIEFDWENDYPSGQELTAIPNEYRTERAPKTEHGTLLRIEGLYDAWDDAARKRVRRAVRLLQPPFPVARAAKQGREVDPGFVVDVEIDGQPDSLVLPGYDDFLQAGTAHVRLRLMASGVARVEVTSDHLQLNASTRLSRRYRRCGPLRAEASYFIFRSDALGGVPMTVARNMAEEFAGVRLYRDGLRVMPYGEKGNDWLGLDELHGSRTTLVPLANQNWFGQIAISRDTNVELRDTASREGLVENAAFGELREVVRQALIWAASEVGAARNKKVTTSDKRPGKSRRDLLSAVRRELVQTVRDELPNDIAKRVVPVIETAAAAAAGEAAQSDASEERRIEELIDELELLRVLASLGTSIAVFSHEVRSALTTSAAALGALPAKGAAAEQLERAREAIDELQDLAGYIDTYVSASQRRVREPQPLAAVIDSFIARLSSNLARNVLFETTVRPAALRTTPMARSEIEAILINLLTNAIKAMDVEGHPDRRVSIAAIADNGELRLRVQDTGTGIDPKIRERIFEPFITDTRSPVSELGSGTGLGLKIVRDIAEGNGGGVEVTRADAPYSTCVEVRLPRWDKQKGGRP